VNVSDLWYSGDFEKWIFKKTDHVYNLELEKISIIWNFISLKENQYLDFWWIVKWYTVDLCSDFLRNKWYTDFIINAWWDIFISGNNNLWKIPVVAIDSPFKNSDIFAILELKDISISTSWTYKRKWNIDNNDFHHIINPFFWNNNNELISVSIINEKCSLADAYATSCIAMWLEKSINFLEKNWIDGVIICSDWKVFNSKWIEKYNFEIV
jgi:thiamine biosynthesis lipoprotein